MSLRSLLLACWLPLLLLGSGNCAAPAAIPGWLQSGARWFVLGDSITQRGSSHPQVLLFLLTGHPKQAITVLNAGVSSDTATGALTHLDWHVLAHQPSVVSLNLSLNDVDRYREIGAIQSGFACPMKTQHPERWSGLTSTRFNSVALTKCGLRSSRATSTASLRINLHPA